MKKIWRGLPVLLGLLVLAAAAFTLRHGNEAPEETAETEAEEVTSEELAVSSLPVIFTNIGGQQMNVLHGYVTEQDLSYSEIPLIPVTDRKLELSMTLGGNQASSVAWDITCRGTNNPWMQGTFEGWDAACDTISLSAQLEQPLSPEQDYLLCVTVTLESGKTVMYYARIREGSDLNAGPTVRYVMKFHEDTLDPDATSDYSSRLEQDGSADTTTLADVNIHSSLSQVSWGSLSPTEVEGSLTGTILEMDDSFSSIELNYEITAGESAERYLVTEYYSVQYNSTAAEFYLMDFRRTVTELFSTDVSRFADGSLDFGIVSQDDVELSESADGAYVSFSVGGELWCCCPAAQQLTKVFSFRDEDDLISNVRNFRIKPLQTESDGSVDFIIAGYMNRGAHEGDTGIAFLRYDAAANVLKEQFFLPYSGSIETLEESVDTLSAMNSSGLVYLTAGDSLYEIDCAQQTSVILVDQISSSHLTVNSQQTAMAWVGTAPAGTEEEQKEDSEDETVGLQILYLDTGETQSLAIPSGEKMIPEGFIGDDCIIGIGPEGETAELDGESTNIYTSVIIQGRDGTREAEYAYEGIYISRVTVLTDQIELDRMKKTSAGYQAIDSDTLMATEAVTEDGELSLTQHTDDTRKAIWRLDGIFPSAEVTAVDLIVPLGINYEASEAFSLETVTEYEDALVYYGYGEGERRIVSDTAGEAIAAVFDCMGTVMDSRGNIVWYRTSRGVSSKISLPETLAGTAAESMQLCVQMMAESAGVTPGSGTLNSSMTAMEAVEAVMPGKALNLTGAPVKALLYYVYRGEPVMVIDSSQQAKLLIGYDQYNVKYYDPSTGGSETQGLEDAGNALADYTCIGFLIN